MTDKELALKISKFEQNFIRWAKSRRMWHDSGFSSYLEHHEDEPSNITACITVLTTEGPIFNMLNHYSDGYEDFEAFMETQDFWYEKYNHYTLHFYSKDDALNKEYIDYFEWQWITELIKPDYTNLYSEIFEYFYKKPERFYDLHHRKFEILISEIFKNQGYESILGPGRNDGGVDVKLFENNGIDQLLTLVQVKKYKPTLPIKLEAVAALSGIVHTTENAHKGLFVSTSGYAPVARKFAARQNSKIILADSTDVSKWCGKASSRLLRDKSILFTDKYLESILEYPGNNSLVGQILVRDRNYSYISADFYIIVKDTPNVSLIMLLPSRQHDIYDPPYETRGTLLPVTDGTAIDNRVKEKVFRASKSLSDSGRLYFRADKDLLTLWDGRPVYYDWND